MKPSSEGQRLYRGTQINLDSDMGSMETNYYYGSTSLCWSLAALSAHTDIHASS
jgi:hypothetical protein